MIFPNLLKVLLIENIYIFILIDKFKIKKGHY
jgi:hypothetical protein